MKIAVFGGGIAGLSAVDELIKYPKTIVSSIHLYEASESLGGQCKSYRSPDGGHPSEVSWRGYGAFYKNVFGVMQSIPSIENNLPGEKLSVYDTELSMPMQFIFCREKDHENPVTLSGSRTKGILSSSGGWWDSVPYKDRVILLFDFLRVCLACNERSDSYYSSQQFKSYISNKISSVSQVYLTSLIGPWIGIDPRRCSMFHFFNFFRMIAFPDLKTPFVHYTFDESSGKKGGRWEHKSNSQWLVLRRPTSEAWINPWEKKLITDPRVVIHYNTSLVSLATLKGNPVITLQSDKSTTTLKYDGYIIATTPFALRDVISRSSKFFRLDPTLAKFEGLVADGPHRQVSFRIGFKQEILLPERESKSSLGSDSSSLTSHGNFIPGSDSPLKGPSGNFIPGSNLCFIFPDSEYNITLYFQDKVYHPSVFLGEGIKTLISGTACISYNPGRIFKRSVDELVSIDEFKQEVLSQISDSTIFNTLISESNPSSTGFSSFEPYLFEVWKGWKFTKNGVYQTPNELKWVNSYTNTQYIPGATTGFKNIVLAGAHVSSSVELYSMEAACSTGIDAARILLKQNTPLFSTPLSHGIAKPLFFRILIDVDRVLYEGGLPNVLDVVGIAVVIGAIIAFITKRKK